MKRHVEREKTEVDVLDKIFRFLQANAVWVILGGAAIIIIGIIVIVSLNIREARTQKFLREFHQTEIDSEKLLQLEREYKDLDIFWKFYPDYLYKLGNAYYRENKLIKAKQTYDQLRQQYPHHYLIPWMEDAYIRLLADIELSEEIPIRHEENNLIYGCSPYYQFEGQDPRELPVPHFCEVKVELTTSTGNITINLFEDEAPEAVANFINLIENTKFFEDLNVWVDQEKKKVKFGPKDGVAGNLINFEHTLQKPQPGALLMVRDPISGKNRSTEFEILLQYDTALSDNVTIFGMVEERSFKEVLTKLSPTDKITGGRIVKKGKHKYRSFVFEGEK